MRKSRLILIALMFCLLSASCGQAPAAPATDKSTAAAQLPEKRLVPEVVLLTYTPQSSPERYEFSQILAKAWEQLGIKTNMVALDFMAVNARQRSKPFDWDASMYAFLSRAERLDPDTLLYRVYHSSQAVEGGLNVSGYVNKEVDSLLDQQRAVLDANKRKEIVFKLQDILAKELPTITMYHEKQVRFYNNRRFKGYVPVVAQGIFNVYTVANLEAQTSDKMWKMGDHEALKSLNPYVLATVAPMEVIYDRLARISPDGQVVPWAAKSWNVIDDKTIEVQVRTDMKWHDGKDVTVQDVKFSFDYPKENKIPILMSFLDCIKSVDVVGNDKIRFNLQTPFAPFFYTTLTQVPLVPRHVWVDVVKKEGLKGPEEYRNQKPIGSGPMAFSYWRSGEECKLVTHKSHFSKPKIDGIIFREYGNPESVYLALKKQEIDTYRESISIVSQNEAKTLSYLTRVEVPDASAYMLALNVRRLPFSDPNFRKAIAHTFDYDTLVKTIFADLVIKGKGIIAPGNSVWHNPNQPTYNFDLKQARKVLEDAGYKWDAKGRLYFPESLVK